MAIGFIRVEHVQRSKGQNACCKAAYNSKAAILFSGHEFAEKKLYNWSFRDTPPFHEIILPDHVDKKFLDPEFLWNEVEKVERRINSQVALDVVLALPDDAEISLEDRIHLAKSFAKKHFVDHGLAVQINIHSPEKKMVDGNEVSENHNWHAHILVTTRRFTEDGKELGAKARDLMPDVRYGRVVSEGNWVKLWTEHQNEFFEEKGLSLRVDSNGIVPQIHLGPVRMRGKSYDLIEENSLLESLNLIESQDPAKILTSLTNTKSVFTFDDVERYLAKYVERELIPSVREEFWKQNEIVSLFDSKSQTEVHKFTTRQVLKEEKQIIRLADKLAEQGAHFINESAVETNLSKLNDEQKRTFNNILSGQKLACIEGHAGTGKSYLLVSLKNVYEKSGYIVRAFGPDNATAKVLKEKGFQYSENIYKFLFALHNDRRDVKKNKEIWVIDEAGKLGNRPLLELLKYANKNDVQIILSGCSAQLASVERGGMFKVFCQKYGCQVLRDIQRQSGQSERAISQHLAYGKVSKAIDLMADHGSINWSDTKNEAIRSLISKWFADYVAFPDRSSIIIAHTNEEVNLLNECVREMLKDRNEIEKKEYLCETALGRVYLSVGDKIEFRKNDNNLNIENGTIGILTDASEKEFTVSITENNKIRSVTFDPSSYIHFRPGYASTYFKSQGKTIERAYVLHSPQINKELFYVGMTRHVKKAYYFVSYDEAASLTDLKKQALRRSTKETTCGYLTYADIENQTIKQKRSQEIRELTTSSSLVDRMRGYSIIGFGYILDGLDSLKNKIADSRPDKRFFNPVQMQPTKGYVLEVKELVRDLDSNVKNPQVDSHSVVKGQKTNECLVRNTEQSCSFQKNKTILDEYFSKVEKASTLYSIVRAESGGISEKEKFTHHFKEWQEACFQRNECAWRILKSVSETDVKRIFRKNALKIIESQSLRFSVAQEKNDYSSKKLVVLESRLKENIEPLLYRLYPGGPTRKDRNGLRFGAKGSVYVQCLGNEKGRFYDHESRYGGGPIQLIQNVMKLSAREAVNWANDFLGNEKALPKHENFNFERKSNDLINNWKSLKPPHGKEAPALKQISLGLSNIYKEAGRYSYKDINGDLLFYTLRLEEKENPSKKIVLPLSYGHSINASADPKWALKGYQTDIRPLYNLQLLKQHHSSTILIVEGEKTAEAASMLFEKKNIICLTWLGGASAVSKSDWNVLKDRDVIIWPDNDTAGYKAADEICLQLRQVGISSLRVVDKDLLSKEFPTKWDLADPIPNVKNKNIIHDILLNAKEKGVVLSSTKDASTLQGVIESQEINDILCRVEARLRPALEAKFGGKTWEVRSEIVAETMKIFTEKSATEVCLRRSSNERIANNLAYQIAIFKAKVGCNPSNSQIKEMKAVISEYGFIRITGTTIPELRTHATNKAICSFIESNYLMKQEPYKNVQIANLLEKEANKNVMCMKNMLSENLSSSQVRELDRSRSLSLNLFD